MTDSDGTESRAAQCCGDCGEPRIGDEEICDNCNAVNWVMGSSSQPQATQPVSGQLKPPAPEPDPAADQEPVTESQAAPEPVVIPDPVTTSRSGFLIASFTAKGNAFSHTLAAGETVALGRDPDWSPLGDRFAADDSVSRKHAELTLGADGRAQLTDVGSRNRTVVNGKELPHNAPWTVTRRDQIALGEHTTLSIRIIGGSGLGPASAGGDS